MNNTEILTWLNGRVDKIVICLGTIGGKRTKKIEIWNAKTSGISIEDAVIKYIKENKIKWKDEVYI